MTDRPSRQNDGSVEQVAARWAARESLGALTVEDQQALDAWVAADAVNRAAYDAARATMQKLSSVQGALRGVDHAQQARAVHRRGAMIRGGGALAVSVAIASFFFGSDFTALTADHGAGPGQIKHVTLPDGTSVMLDTRSAIDVHYSSHARDIVLVSGRASFDVAHGDTRPFTVRALEGEVRDIGTAFVVRHIGDHAEVIVTQGEVRVSYQDRSLSLLEGRGARWGAGDGQQSKPFDVSTALGWRAGRIVVDRQPLAEVIAELNRYRRRPIVLLDRSAGRRIVSGVVLADHIEDGIGSLATAQGLNAIRLPFATLLIPER